MNELDMYNWQMSLYEENVRMERTVYLLQGGAAIITIVLGLVLLAQNIK